MSGSIALVLVLIFLSGASGLVYEVLWTRQLALVFGVTTYAVSTVLATYMGGLALGSYLVGRQIDRVGRPLVVYAGLEAAIGLYALLVPSLLGMLRPAYVELSHLGLSYPVFSLVRSLMAASLLLIPTAMMGGTFPVLVRHWSNTGLGVKRGTGIVYLVNTAGAIVGCSLAGFFLIERFGLTGSSRIAASTNVILGLVAWRIARRQVVGTDAKPRPVAPVEGTALAPATRRLVLACAGLSGFISLVAEVLWSRALLRYLYNSTYAFTAMLSAFLLGITVGSVLYTVFLSHRRRPLLILALLQGGVAIGFTVTVALFPYVPDLTAWVFGGDIVGTFRMSLALMLLRATVILSPPVVLLGAIFPMAAVLYAAGRHDVGAAMGRAYAVNTFGAILGSLGAAFVLIPWIGMWGTQKLLILLSLLSAGAVGIAATSAPVARLAVASTVVALVAVAPFLAPVNVFRSTFLQTEGMHLDFYEEGATDTVAVQSGHGMRSIVYEDQRGTASTASYDVNFFLGHLPMLLHPSEPRRVLHICFGVGNSLSAIAGHEELERVDNVELSPHVLTAASYFWTNDGVLDHPKVNTVIDDGRNFLMTTDEIYDVILLEPPETFTAGVINLYTVEFYRDALAHLAPDGIMVQWVPTANGTLDEERQLFRAFSDVFPHATMWWQMYGGCALLVGTKQPLRIDYSRLREHMKEPRVRQDMDLIGIRDADHFLSHFVFDEPAFAEFVRDAHPTRDDFTVLDFTMPRFAGSGFGLGQFNPHVQTAGGNPISITVQRRNQYLSRRRSVLPLLTNLGGESPETVGARIKASRKHGQAAKWFDEEGWRRMREAGRIPASGRPSTGNQIE